MGIRNPVGIIQWGIHGSSNPHVHRRWLLLLFFHPAQEEVLQVVVRPTMHAQLVRRELFLIHQNSISGSFYMTRMPSIRSPLINVRNLRSPHTRVCEVHGYRFEDSLLWLLLRKRKFNRDESRVNNQCYGRSKGRFYSCVVMPAFCSSSLHLETTTTGTQSLTTANQNYTDATLYI